MEIKAVQMLNRHRLMALGTVRSDGWPQVTLVGYVNDGLLLHFLVSRAGQKFRNIATDDRVSIAIGRDAADLKAIEGLSIAAHASEVTDDRQRQAAHNLLIARHPGYAAFGLPDFSRAAIMRARCTIVTISDYSMGFGHAEVISVGPRNLTQMRAVRPDDWGLNPSASG